MVYKWGTCQYVPGWSTAPGISFSALSPSAEITGEVDCRDPGIEPIDEVKGRSVAAAAISRHRNRPGLHFNKRLRLTHDRGPPHSTQRMVDQLLQLGKR